MKIKFSIEGGFIGLNSSFEENLNSFPAEHQKAISELIHESNAKVKGNPLAADTFKYTLQVQDGTQNKVLQFDDLSIPQKYRKLFEFLRQKSDEGK